MNERSDERTNADDTEVELDADQLAALARVEVTAKREDRLTTATSESVAASSSSVTGPSGTQSQGRTALLRIAVPMALVVAAVATAGAIYSRTLQPDTLPPAPRSAPASSAMPDWVTQEIEPQSQPEPVRFANPFDKSEVFEFPSGTSKEEARTAVANILLERASERRAIDPKLRSKHR